VRGMKKLEFKANHIPTSDYGYIHFSTSERQPETYLLFRRNAPITVKESDHETKLDLNDFKMCLSKTCLTLSIIDDGLDVPYNGIKVFFEVNDGKWKQIKDRLKEIYYDLNFIQYSFPL